MEDTGITNQEMPVNSEERGGSDNKLANGNKVLIIVICIMVGVLFGFAGYIVGMKQKESKPINEAENKEVVVSDEENENLDLDTKEKVANDDEEKEESADSDKPVGGGSTNSDLEKKDICADDQTLITLTNNFENMQHNKNASGVLAMFTPATDSQSIEEFNNLSGVGVSAPRLYGNVSLGYSMPSYEVVGKPYSVTNPNGGCSITVRETRTWSGGPAAPNDLVSETHDFVITFVKYNGEWKIYSYVDPDPLINVSRYSGFLREYKRN